MRRWHIPFLGLKKIPPKLTPFEIEQFFTLSAREIEVISTRERGLHRLAVALQVGFLRMAGRPLLQWQVIPAVILEFLGEQLQIEAPTIASLRALYQYRTTLFNHQSFAGSILGFQPMEERPRRGLMAHLNREAEAARTADQLILSAKRWLYEHRYLIPAERRIQDLVRHAIAQAELAMFERVCQEIPEAVRTEWMRQLFEPDPTDFTQSIPEWLQEPPRHRSKKNVRREVAKLAYMKAQRMDEYPLSAFPLERLRVYSQRMIRRRPARFHALAEPRRTLELVSFCRITLLEVTDVILRLFERTLTEIVREARARAEHRELQQAGESRQLIEEVTGIIHDPSLPAEAMRDRLRLLLPAPAAPLPRSRADRVRKELVFGVRPISELFWILTGLTLEAEPTHPVMQAVEQLKSLYGQFDPVLPTDVSCAFAPRWNSLVQSPDRHLAFYAFAAATVLALRRSLRNGSIWVPHSFSYRHRDAMFIPAHHWETHRAGFYRQLMLPQDVEEFLRPLKANLSAALSALAEAVEAGEIVVEENQLRIHPLQVQPVPSSLDETRIAMFRKIGPVQFPDLMIEVDSHIRYSWTLLGRPPRSEKELVALYAALVALGTEMDAPGVAKMLPSSSEVSEELIRDLMHLLDEGQPLKQANALAVDFMRRHPITQLWGGGTLASADMMSLDVSRQLWNARADPRRHTHAVGIYTHILDQWGIIYDQPIVLNQRQAGAAIEGAVRQETIRLERVSVDTHGYTDAAMGWSKIMGFDLCPRLAHLRERRLFVPKDVAVPDVLTPVVESIASLKQVSAGWDGFVRVAASIYGGWTSAALALQRFGSAARGDPIYKAAVMLGKLFRTLYLCDLLSNPSFRREVFGILDHGESIHSLQRAIHSGAVGPKEGRRQDEMIAISGALTFLANLVMAWNIVQMQRVIDRWHTERNPFADPTVLAHIAPVHFGQVNFKGIFSFAISRYRTRLIENIEDRDSSSGKD